MDKNKKAEFVRKMGKKRLCLYRGGHIKRKNYDGGGTVNTQGSGFAAGIGNLLGTENDYQAGTASLQPGVTADQLNASYNQAQTGLGYQQNLVDQLQAQNAIQNQNNVYNQAAGVAAGTGPNPAQAMLNQQTGQNVANQAALMAGQRGASANAGLIARQAAQQGAGIQQAATGQAASLEAQQRLNAINTEAGISGQQVGNLTQGVQGLNTATQNEQNILQGANTALNNANVGMQSNINSTNAQVAAGNQAANTSLIGGLVNGAASIFAKGGEVEAPKNYDRGGDVSGYNAIVSGGNNSIPGIMPAAPMNISAASYDTGKAFGKAGGSLFKNIRGGSASKSTPAHVGGSDSSDYTDTTGQGGSSAGDYNSDAVNSWAAQPENMDIGAAATPAPAALEASDVGAIGGLGELGDVAVLAASRGGKICQGPHKSHVANYLMSKGGKVPAMVSPGEIYLSPEQVQKVVHEGANPIKVGQKFQGKAKVKGDSKKNDTIPITLREGGVVIPRHIVKHKMAPEKAELFVRRAVAHKRMG